MKKNAVLFLLAIFSLLCIGIQPVKADGIVIPPPTPCPVEGCIWGRPMVQLDIRYHHVRVEIEDQIATTHVDQVFYNPNDYPVEGTYIFPLPAEAVVSDFVLWIDGQPVKGEVLDANQARQTYEQIVNSMRDPALLEYIGRGAVQASIFPIPPQGERRIELEYNQVLTAENGLVRYVYPLNTEKFSRSPLESVSVTVHVKSSQALRAVYSPSHLIGVNRVSDLEFIASYEAQNITPDADFALYFSQGTQEAFHLFTYHDPTNPADPDGFFMLLLAPDPGAQTRAVAKDILLVLDHSGSMEGEKFQQAQAAARYILSHLNAEDRFYMTSFSSDIQRFADELRPATDADKAVEWVNQLSAVGSTDINTALLEAAAVADRERPTYLIFITDGLPTAGETYSDNILRNFNASAPGSLRLFSFGVGYDVDTYLLDSLSKSHHGLSTYVRPGEALDEILSAFYASISTPVLTNLALDFGALETYDIYPNPLPDLFKGSQIVVVGRYREGGLTNITLSGYTNGEKQTYRYPEQSFAVSNHTSTTAEYSLPRLWATRKIGYLLEQIRLEGPNQETVDQIVSLSIRYGIVTPYTSYLVTEPMPLGAANQQDLSERTFETLMALPTVVSGMGAVDKAAGEGQMAQAQSAPAVPGDDAGNGRNIRIVNTRTFILDNGIWLDTAYDPDTMSVQKIDFLSQEYFTFASTSPDLAAALALGERVIIVFGGTAYEIGAGSTSPVITREPVGTPVPLPNHTPEPGTTASPVDPTSPAATTTPGTSPVCAAGLLPLLFLALVKFLRH